MDTIAVALANKLSNGGIMVNFGGDLSAIRPKLDQTPWIIEIENPKAPQSTLSTIKLRQGAIATSGNAKRFAINKKGKTLGYILNPKTGWPVSNSPASVTVVAKTATQCGLLSTYAMLKGEHASDFLQQEDLDYFFVCPS